MPIIDGKLLTPAAAIAQKRCPECGADLTKVNAIAELNSHWQTAPKDDRRGHEAYVRRELLLEYIAGNKITINDPNKRKAAAATA